MEIVTPPPVNWIQQKLAKKIKSMKKARAALRPSSEPFYFFPSEHRGPIAHKILHRGKGKFRGIKYIELAGTSLSSGTLPTKPTELGSLATAVQRFVTSNNVFPQGTIISSGGKPVARLVPITIPPADDGEWTPAKNQRRAELIDRKIDRSITPEELAELDALTEQMRRFIDRVAPLPLEPLRRIHQQLVEKAIAAEREKQG